MIEVTNMFKEAIYAPSRKTRASVRFEILDTTAYKENNIIVPSEVEFSKSIQLTNKIRVPSNKIVTLEKDYFKLDGTFSLPLMTNNEKEIGYWGASLTDKTGTFTIPETFQITFIKEHSSMGLTIYFDVLNNEYATKFNIYFYNDETGLYKTINVDGNNKAIYELVDKLGGYKKIIIEVIKWCKPFRRCKIIEVDFGIIKVYEDSNLIKVDLIQELDHTSSNLPSDEMKFTIDNLNKEFNPLNPTGYAAYLQQGQEAFLTIGVEVEEGKEVYEDIQISKLYLKEQQSDEGTLTSTFTCRDIFDLLSNDEIENLATTKTNLYEFATSILTLCGIENYRISNNLKQINTQGVYKKMSYRSLLQLIAIAGMCVVYSDNKGVVEFKQLVEARTVLGNVEVINTDVIGSKEQIFNNVLNIGKKYLTLEKDFFRLDGTYNLPENNVDIETGWISSTLSNFKGVYETPIPISINLTKEQTGANLNIIFDKVNNEYATDFVIKAFNSTGALLLVEYFTDNNKIEFKLTNRNLVSAKTVIVEITKWCKPYRRARVIEIGFNLPEDHISLDDMYAKPEIINNEVIKAVKVKYYPTDLENPVEYTYTDISRKNGITVELDNSLINSESHAIEVARWIIANSSDNTFTANYRGNPRISLSDKISIQNGYGFNNIVNVGKHELSYQGYLKGKIEGRGSS